MGGLCDIGWVCDVVMLSIDCGGDCCQFASVEHIVDPPMWWESDVIGEWPHDLFDLVGSEAQHF